MMSRMTSVNVCITFAPKSGGGGRQGIGWVMALGMGRRKPGVLLSLRVGNLAVEESTIAMTSNSPSPVMF